MENKMPPGAQALHETGQVTAAESASSSVNQAAAQMNRAGIATRSAAERRLKALRHGTQVRGSRQRAGTGRENRRHNAAAERTRPPNRALRVAHRTHKPPGNGNHRQ